MKRFLALVGLLVLSVGVAHAQALTVVNPLGGIGEIWGPNSVRIVDGVGATTEFIGRNWGAPSSVTGSGSARVLSLSEAYGLEVGGKGIQVAAARGVSALAIANAALALGAAAYVGAQLGAPISKALGNTDVQIGDTRCVATYTGWQCDAGEPPTVTTVGAWPVTIAHPLTGESNVITGPSKLAACSAAFQWYVDAFAHEDAQWVYTATTVAQTTVNGDSCYQAVDLVGTRKSDGYVSHTSSYPIGHIGAFSDSQTQECPAVIDALNPAYSRPAGGAPNADGQCPTGRYSAATPEQVAPKLATNMPTSSLPELAEDTLQRGQPIEANGPRSLSGPGSATRTPTVTTTNNPDGTTNTRTSTVTNNYTYQGDQITYNTTTVTVTTNNTTGATTTETTTAGGDSEPVPDPCETHPDRAGCANLGEPAGGDPQWQTKSIAYEVYNLGLPSGCPAPRLITFRSWTWAMDYTVACNQAPVISAGLIAMCALGCAVFITRAVSA